MKVLRELYIKKRFEISKFQRLRLRLSSYLNLQKAPHTCLYAV